MLYTPTVEIKSEEITKSIFKTHDWINKTIDFLEVYKHEKTFSYLHFPNTHQEWMTPGFENLSFTLNRDDSLGLNLDSSVNYEFEKTLRHKNLLFSNAIDLIHEFFNFERKMNNSILSKSVQLLNKNSKINRLFIKIADGGSFV